MPILAKRRGVGSTRSCRDAVRRYRGSVDRDQQSRSRFSSEEVGEVIEIATRLDGRTGPPTDVTREELDRIAAELGIAPETLAAALAERDRLTKAREEEAQIERTRRQRRKRAWQLWRNHAAAYVTVNGGLYLIDVIPDGTAEWWFFNAIGWGILLTGHALGLGLNRGQHRNSKPSDGD